MLFFFSTLRDKFNLFQFQEKETPFLNIYTLDVGKKKKNEYINSRNQSIFEYQTLIRSPSLIVAKSASESATLIQ